MKPLPDIVSLTPVRTLHRPSAAEFDAAANQGTSPAVLTGCLDDWNLLAQLRAAGDAHAQVGLLESLVHGKVHYTTIAPKLHGQLGYKDDGKGTTFTFTSGKKVPFAQFATSLRNTLASSDGGAVYMQSVPLTTFPDLQPHVPELPYLSSGAEGFRQLWIGSGGHVVNLHFDPTHNLIAMLAGSKRVTLLPPDNMSNLYPAPLDVRLGDAIGSLVKVLDFDQAKHPRALSELAKAQVAVLQPGDVLYIPPMWWHHVESFGLNVMINKWVLPVSSAHFTDITANVVRGILTFSELPLDVRRAYRERYYAAFAAQGGSTGTGNGQSAAAADKHLQQTAQLFRAMPPCLRASLPQLYDYYVFQLDGPPALSKANADGFKRKLRVYAGVVGAIRTVQSLAPRRTATAAGTH